MKRKLISIIVPTRDRTHLIERTINSILDQHGVDKEIIIVDDNEESNVATLSAMFSSIDIVKVVRNIGEHGPSQSRNFGVQNSSGDLITFIDDDDIYLPGRLRSMYEFSCAENDYSFISSGRVLEKGDLEDILEDKGQKFGEIILEDVQYANDIDIGFMLSRGMFDHVGGFDSAMRGLEDWDIIIRCLGIKPGYKIKRLDYAVNIDENRDRISNTQIKYKKHIAEKHKRLFGEKWYLIMNSKIKALDGNFRIIDGFRLMLRTGAIYTSLYCILHSLKVKFINER